MGFTQYGCLYVFFSDIRQRWAWEHHKNKTAKNNESKKKKKEHGLENDWYISIFSHGIKNGERWWTHEDFEHSFLMVFVFKVHKVTLSDSILCSCGKPHKILDLEQNKFIS